MGADLTIYRKWKQCWVSAPVQCLLNWKERELNLKKCYNSTVCFLLWEFCVQVTINMCNSESIFSFCQVGDIDTWSNGMMNKATAKKHLLSVVELQNFPWHVVMFDFSLGEFPNPALTLVEGPSGAAAQGAAAASQGWRAQAKPGMKYPCDWLRGDPWSQLLFICMLFFNASQHFSQKLYNDRTLKYSHLVTSEQWDTAPCHCCPDDLCFSLQQYDNKISVWRRKMTGKSRRLPVVWYDKVPCSVWKYKPFTSVESYLVHSH